MQFDRDRPTSEAAPRLSALEADLRPSSLQERVRAVVLGNRSRGLELDDMDGDGDPISARAHLEGIARELGEAVATSDDTFAELLPDLVRGGNRAWAFGRGLASASPDRRATWARLVEGLERIAWSSETFRCSGASWPKSGSRTGISRNTSSTRHRTTCLAGVPSGSAYGGGSRRSRRRASQASTQRGQTPIWMYGNLALGRATDHVTSVVLKELLLLIAEQPDGFDVAAGHP